MLLIGLCIISAFARGVLGRLRWTFVGISALLFYIFPRYSLEDRFLCGRAAVRTYPDMCILFRTGFCLLAVFSTARLVYGALCAAC